ncbi:MAG: hypothetical protein ABIJ52_06480 [Pseudomonadota bacterium]|nr:hypothetical protein [Pseudomonadota bacterium]
MTKEVRIPLGERNVFYMTGCAAFDTTCCGTGGCAFANVPGFILSWKNKFNSDDFYVSAIEPVTDFDIQNKIREIIRKKEGINQVNFDL